MKSKRSTLTTKPKYFRAPKSKGGAPKVDREGGFNGQGMIRGLSIVTRGEALGHDVWLDSDFVGSVSAAINETDKGAKARFTHPGLSSDGMGKFLGRAVESTSTKDNAQAFADLHFSKAAHSSPDGDLATYVMDLADEDPEAIGMSIVFESDVDAERLHFEQHGGKVVTFDDGWEEWDRAEFRSPDADNTRNLPHARLGELRASDIVDEPAANPNGLFQREQQFAQEATQMAAYALGSTDKRPQLSALGLDADRVAGFVKRYLAENNLEVKPMAIEAATADADEQEDTTPVTTTDDVTPAAETDEAKPDGEGEGAETQPITVQQSQGMRFVEAFGDKGGRWFIEGKSFDECLKLHSESQKSELGKLRQENEQLKKQLAANPSAGETAPIAFSTTEAGEKKTGFENRIRFSATPTK